MLGSESQSGQLSSDNKLCAWVLDAWSEGGQSTQLLQHSKLEGDEQLDSVEIGDWFTIWLSKIPFCCLSAPVAAAPPAFKDSSFIEELIRLGSQIAQMSIYVSS